MNGPLRMALAAAGLALLAGCAGMELEKAEMAPSQGSAFDRGLRDGYLELSKSEFDQGDYNDSDRYAERVVALGEGKTVQPEMIAARALPAEKVDELTAARLRLVSALAEGAAETKPLDAADAQVSFDCWMEQQEENFQADDIVACRDRFMMAMARVEAQPQVAAAPKPMMEKPAPAAYTVLFGFNKADLTAEARAMLADVAAAAKKADYRTIDIGGYTDLVGSEAYNAVLSEQRANAVIDFLVESGVEKEKIVGRGYGKADPVVAVEAPEQRNRRVEIKLEP